MPSKIVQRIVRRRAARLLLDQDISGAPVVDASGALVGILSESDLIWKVCTRHSSCFGMFWASTMSLHCCHGPITANNLRL